MPKVCTSGLRFTMLSLRPALIQFIFVAQYGGLPPLPLANIPAAALNSFKASYGRA